VKSFIACAKTTAVTLLAGYMAIKLFVFVWAIAFDSDLTKVVIYGILWIDYIATVFIGMVAGFLAARFDRVHPVPTGIVAALLVELLILSVGAGLRYDSLNHTVAHLVAAVLLAALIAWWRSRPAASAPQAN
jgi:hypothetical protein